jgi:hypothetical protein
MFSRHLLPNNQIKVYPPFSTDVEQEHLDDIIPEDPQEFYKDFGLLIHPNTGEPVEQLTDYQYEIWKGKEQYRYRAVFKSQKVGLSTSVLLEDFQSSLTDCLGFDILVVAQTQYQANEHLRTLKGLILNSEKYRKYLITKPSDLILKEEKTKVGVAYIKNPKNKYRPSRIIGLGFSESGLWSHKNVKRIHVSDPTVSKVVDDAEIFGAMFSRLANTNGWMIIETPPRKPKGTCFSIYDKYYKNQQKGKWKIYIVKADQAVDAGLISQEFLDDEKIRLGPLYPQFYEAEFLSIGGNIFPYDDIDYCIGLGERYKHLDINPYSLHCGGVDFGFSSSVTALYVGEIDIENQIVRIVLHKEYDKKTPSDIANDMFSLHTQIPNLWWFVDGANRGAVNECKSKYGESLDWTKSEDVNPEDNFIIPVSFQKEHRLMLQNTYQLLTKHNLAIPYDYQKLISALRTAWAIEFDLDKSQTLEDDHLDALRLLLKGVKFEL